MSEAKDIKPRAAGDVPDDPLSRMRHSASHVMADAVRRLRSDGVPVPVYVCWVAPRDADQHAEVLREAGVPCFTWPERT